jgi:hypothetical protein
MRNRSSTRPLIVALALAATVAALVTVAAAWASLSARAAELRVARSAATPTVTQTASSGAVRATYTYSGRYPDYHSETVAIREGGRVVYSGTVRAPDCGTRCAPGDPRRHGHSLQFAALSAGAAPALILNLYSGGAHCCTIVQVFAPKHGASPRWSVSSRSFGDAGYRLEDLNHDGAEEFLSADDRFAYAFTDYAASGLPLQIMAFANGRFTDVTRAYPALITKDAATWMKAFRDQRRSHYADTTGVVAAWAADEENLGRAAAVRSFLNQQARAGHLNSPLAPQVPAGERYVHLLERFLGKLGYPHGAVRH